MKWTIGRFLLGSVFPFAGSVALAKDVYDAICKPKRGPIQMFCMDHVQPIPGSIVCCKLALGWEHSGVYVGNGNIVHRDGDGHLYCVNKDVFLGRLSGNNPAVTVFVSCKNGIPVGGDEIARRAQYALQNPDMAGYNLLTKNCHQFSQYCVTGEQDNGITDFTFSNLESVLERHLGMDSWRVLEGSWS